MFNNPTKHPFRLYYSVPSFSGTIENMQTRFSGCDTHPFRLYAPKDRFLPFQIFIPQADVVVGDLTVTAWEVCDGSGTNIGSATAYNSNLSQLVLFQVYGKGIWWTYQGDVAFGPTTAMSLSCGYYYFRITLGSGRKVVSEVFYVPSDADLASLVYLQWWNDKDFGNDLYSTGFKNKLFTESTFQQSVPEIIKEGIENEEKQFFPTKTIYIDNYLLEDFVPVYLMQSLQAIPLHNNIQFFIPSLSKLFDVNQFEVTDKESDSCNSITAMKISLIERIVNAGNGDTLAQSAVIPLVANTDIVQFAKIGSVSSGTVIAITFNCLTNDTGWSIAVVNPTTFQNTLGGHKARVIANGTIEFKKQPTVSGFPASNPTSDIFFYSIQDGLGNTASGMVQIQFVNIAATDDIYTLTYPSPPGNISINMPSSNGILLNDSFPVGSIIQGTGTPINSTLNANGNTLTINSDGSFTFTLAGNTTSHKYSKFPYTIQDALGGTSTAYVRIEMNWGGITTVPPFGW